jgi:hypothetical protein
MNEFKKWVDRVNEELELSPTINKGTSKPATNDSNITRSTMIGDIDNIMNSLETLAVELTEEIFIELAEDFIIEDAGEAAIDFLIRMPKARKAQQKVNKIKLKVAGLESAAAVAEGPKKKQIQTKVTLVKAQANDLQTAVNKKYEKQSDMVQRALSSEKIKGQLDVIKASMGEGDKTELKAQAQKLQQRLKDEEDAIGDGKPEKSELQQAQEEIEASQKNKKTGVESNDDGNPNDDGKPKEDELNALKDKLAKAKESGDEDEIKKVQGLIDDLSNGGGKPKGGEPKEDELNALKDRLAKAKESGDEDEIKKVQGLIDDLSNGGGEPKNDGKKEAELKTLNDRLAKAKESGDEDEIKKVQDLIDKISAKESWQLDGTQLGVLLEMEIKKLEHREILKESKYQINSIKDAFRKLM